MFVIPDECKPYMAMQVTQYPDDPHFPWKLAVKEAGLYCDWLPKDPMTTLDLGCGLGRTTVMLHRLYGRASGIPGGADTEPLRGSYGYILVDATHTSDRLVGGWLPDRCEWCNDLQVTALFLRANGMPSSNYRFLDLGKTHNPPMDANLRGGLIISTLAVGFHWPLEPYLQALRRVCTTQTVLIFGVRHGKYDGASTFDGFNVIGFAESGWKQDFLALRKA